MSACSRNLHTGDFQKTKPSSEQYRSNYDKIDWTATRMSQTDKVKEINVGIQTNEQEQP